MFKKLMFLAVMMCGCGMALAQSATAAPPVPEQHEFTIKNFKTESGIVLPEARIVVELPAGTTLAQVIDHFRTEFIPGADANNLILQMRTWESNDVGATPGFGGDVEKALKSIKVPVLYMPSATDLYFPVTDAKYEAQFIPECTLLPIPSLWGHPAGAGASPADKKFLNEKIGAFMAGNAVN